MTSKPLLAASAALAGLLSLSTLTLAAEQSSASKPEIVHAQGDPVDLTYDLEDLEPNSRLANKLIDISDRTKHDDVRYRASTS